MLHTSRAHTQTCLLPVTEWRQKIENCLGPYPACQNLPSMPLSLNWAPALALLALAQIPTKAEAAIANESVSTWREQSQLGSWPCLSLRQRQSLPMCTAVHTLGRE